MISESAVSDARILIVDDSPANLKLATKIFDEAGFRSLRTVSRSSEAMSVIGEFQPDLICLDLHMPPPDGFHLLKEIREKDGPVPIQVIILTIHTDSKTRLKVLNQGANDFLAKPFDPTEVLARVRNQIRVRQLTRALYEKNQDLEQLVQKRTSELLLANQKLKKSEQSIRQIIETAHDGFMAFNADCCIEDWNHKAESTFGLGKQEVLGKPVCDIIVADRVRSQFEEIITEIFDNLNKRKSEFTSRMEFPGMKKNGEIFSMELLFFKVGSADRNEIAAFVDNVTDHKIMQAQLHQAQRMESIGQLAAGIAHEINTPTQYIGDNLEFLKESFQQELTPILKKLDNHTDVFKNVFDTGFPDLEFLLQEIPLSIDQSLEGIRRVSKIVRAMKEFSHPGGDEKISVDINKAIETAVTVSRNEWKYVCGLEMELDPNLPMIQCFADQFNQVMLNLIINAAHAISDVVDGTGAKGKLLIRSKNHKDEIEVSVADSGTGIPEDIRSKIFDPFFTTKEVGKGTGQGLSIVHNFIVKKHGGRIAVESTLGKGTHFTLWLPKGKAANDSKVMTNGRG